MLLKDSAVYPLSLMFYSVIKRCFSSGLWCHVKRWKNDCEENPRRTPAARFTIWRRRHSSSIQPMLFKLLIAAKFERVQAKRRYRAGALTTSELITLRSALITSAIVCDVSVDKSQLNCIKCRFWLRRSSPLEIEGVKFFLNSAFII